MLWQTVTWQFELNFCSREHELQHFLLHRHKWGMSVMWVVCNGSTICSCGQPVLLTRMGHGLMTSQCILEDRCTLGWQQAFKSTEFCCGWFPGCKLVCVCVNGLQAGLDWLCPTDSGNTEGYLHTVATYGTHWRGQNMFSILPSHHPSTFWTRLKE